MDFPYGPLAPDMGDNSPGALMVADGVQPIQAGYEPYPSLSISSSATALVAQPRGMYSFNTAAGVWKTVAGTATTIEILASDFTWSSIDTAIALTAGDDWSFERFGTKLLYTNTTQGMRAYDVESAAVAAVTNAKSPEHIFECGNMLFGLNCLDSAGNRDNRLIRSSKFSDHTVWTGAGTDYQPLESGGALVWGGKLTDTTALVLQQRAVKLIQVGNVGGGALWGIQSIGEEFGSVGRRSVVAFDGKVFWVATDGFHMFTQGGGLQHIGAGKVDNWFLDRVDTAQMSLIQGAVDPYRKNVMWRWKRAASGSTTVFEDIIGYNWAMDRWFTLTLQTAYIGFAATAGTTYASYSGTYAEATETYDSRALQGGQPLMAAFNSTYKFGFFGGSNMAATFQTGVANSKVGALVNWATPVDDSPDGTLELGTKDTLSNSTVWETGEAKNSETGDVPLRGRGLNIAFRRNITAGSNWSYAKGIDHVGARAGGPR